MVSSWFPMSQKRDPSTGSGQAMGHPGLRLSILSPNYGECGVGNEGGMMELKKTTDSGA